MPPASWDPIGTAVVTKIRLPQTTGAEWPRPGIAVRHVTPSLSPQVTGASPVAIPFSSGPRHDGQSWAVAGLASNPIPRITAKTALDRMCLVTRVRRVCFAYFSDRTLGIDVFPACSGKMCTRIVR